MTTNPTKLLKINSYFIPRSKKERGKKKKKFTCGSLDSHSLSLCHHTTNQYSHRNENKTAMSNSNV